MKSVIVVQAQNALAYLPAFIAHHRRLVDKIIILDHNSASDLRSFSHEDVEIFRISAKNFAKDLFTSYFINKLNLKKEFNFLFLLDIDEFLPFSSRAETRIFMENHRHDAVVSMYWRNGFPASDEPISGRNPVYFTRWRTSTRKLAYNLKRLKRILPIEGNHNAKYPILDSLLLQFRPRRKDSGLGLLHIPFTGLHGLRHKLDSFPAFAFRNKIGRDMSAMGISDDFSAKTLNLSEEDLMLLVANYREPDIRPNVNASSFEEVPFLRGLEGEIAQLSHTISQCQPAPSARNGDGEDAVISKLRANRILYTRRLSRSFGLQADGTYAFNV